MWRSLNELQAPSPPSQHSPEHWMFSTTCRLIQLGLQHTSRAGYLCIPKSSTLIFEWMWCPCHPLFAGGCCAISWPAYSVVTNWMKQRTLTFVGPSLWLFTMNWHQWSGSQISLYCTWLSSCFNLQLKYRLHTITLNSLLQGNWNIWQTSLPSLPSCSCSVLGLFSQLFVLAVVWQHS